ncbi:MAG: YdcF family protein [Actinomycetota bacterium]
MSSGPAPTAPHEGGGAGARSSDDTPVSLDALWFDDASSGSESGAADEGVPSDAVTPPGGQVRDEPAPAVVDDSGSGRSWGRWVVRGVLAVVIAGLLYFLISLLQVWSTGRADATDQVDAIVVMGAAQYDGTPSPQLAARLDHVVELWPTDVAPLVVVTGGNLPGDRFTEAEASAAYLVERGVPEEAILLEDEGTNSFESLSGVAEILGERDLGEVLIVTDPYHALRSRLIADEVGLDASVSSTDTSVVEGGRNVERHLQEAAGVAVGRIIGFERLTDLTD